MRRTLLALAGAAALGVAAPPGRPDAGPPTTPALEAPAPTAVATPALPGRRAALTVKLHYEMVCGRPGRGPLVLELPAAMRVPRTIPAGAVSLQGKPAPAVAVAGHVVAVTVPAPHGIGCYSITTGTLTATIARAAGLVNPRAAGTYAVRARIGGRSFAAPLSIGA